jgi:hypothetical protein
MAIEPTETSLIVAVPAAERAVPGLTIGNYAPWNALAHAAEAVAAQLPIHAAVDAVQLIAGAPEPDSWHTLREFQLART